MNKTPLQKIDDNEIEDTVLFYKKLKESDKKYINKRNKTILIISIICIICTTLFI